MKPKQKKVQKKNQVAKVATKPKRKYTKRIKKPKDRGPLTINYLPIMNKRIQTRKTIKIELDADDEDKDRFEYTNVGDMMITQVLTGLVTDELADFKRSIGNIMGDSRPLNEFFTQNMDLILASIKCTDEDEKKKLIEKMVKLEFLIFPNFYFVLKIYFLIII